MLRIIFCIYLCWCDLYLSFAFQKEITIEPIDTGFPRFIQCSNSKCNSVFPINTQIEIKQSPLCPSCVGLSQISHIIQCRTCQSILGFFEIEDIEAPNVFYVERCQQCHGTSEDEQKIQPFMYPHLML